MKASFIAVIVVGLLVILLGVFIMARRSVKTIRVPSQTMYQPTEQTSGSMMPNETGTMSQQGSMGTTQSGSTSGPAQNLNSVEQAMPTTSTDLGTVDQLSQ